MNELNQEIKLYVEALVDELRITPTHKHYKSIIGIEKLEAKINSTKDSELLYDDIIKLKFKEVLSLGVTEEIKNKSYESFAFKDNYDDESWEYAEDYVSFCLEKFLSEEQNSVNSLWQERMDKFIGTEITRRKRINDSDYTVPNHIRDYIIKSPNGPELLYRLTYEKKLIKSLNEKKITESLNLIEQFEDHNFLVIRDFRKGFSMFNFNNDSRIFQGLSRLSAVFWGAIAVICVFGIGFESHMDIANRLGILILILAALYALHMLTLWVLDGFTNSNKINE